MQNLLLKFLETTVFIYFLTLDVNCIRIYTVSKNFAKEVQGPVDLIHGSHFRDLRCEGKEPLEWVYTGNGRPSKVKEFTRRTKSDIIQSQLAFDVRVNSTDYSYHTGTYTCRALRDTSVNASVYAYFQNPVSPFIDGLSPTKALYLPEVLPHGKFVIPCTISQPDISVVLYQLYETDKVVHDFIRLSVPHDPKVGFTLTLPQNATVASLAGGYVCKTENYTQEFGITYAVYPPKVVKPSPPENIVYVGKVLNLTCEFNEPVLIKETESSQPIYDDGSIGLSAEDEIEETTETTPTNKHIANYIDTDPVPGSFGEFQCMTDSPEKTVLHTWNYLVIGKEADELSGIKYSKKKHEFRCKSKGNEPGLLSFVHCATPSECGINHVCVEKSDACEGYPNPLKNPNRCKSKGSDKACTKVRHNGGSGFIRCIADGIDEIKRFDENGLRSSSSVPMKLNLTLEGAGVEDESRSFKLTLLRSPYHFIDGQRWSVIHDNGTDEQVEDLIAVSEKHLSREKVFAQIKIPTEIANPLKIICRIPLRNSLDWKVVTVDIASNEANVTEVFQDGSVTEIYEVTNGPPEGNADLSDDTGEMTTTFSSAPRIIFV